MPTRATAHAAWPQSCAVNPASPQSKRRRPWAYDAQRYRRRNEMERLFGRLKRFRRIATRYDKLDMIFLSGICLALLHDLLTSIENRPQKASR